MTRTFRPACVLLAMTLIACAGDSPTTPPPVATVSLSPATATIQVGQTQQFTAATLGSSGTVLTGRTISWTTSDASIAAVASGVVTGMKPGSVTVSATSEGKSASVSLTVTPGALASVRVVLSDSVIVMGHGTTATAQPLDANGNLIANLPLTYSSGDTSIAVVSTAGGVSGLYEGVVQVQASAGGKTGTATLRVLLDPNVAAAYFKRVPNGMPDLSYYISAIGGSAFMTSVVVADLNKDGRQDLVFHIWHMQTAIERATLPLSTPTPNRLIALIANADGTYSDQTQQLFGSRDVDIAGAASRKVRVADLNGDGYPDWVYATHREDGRACCEAQRAKLTGVLSSGAGTYRVVTISDTPAYHHSVELVRMGAGGFDLLATGLEAYSVSAGTFSPVSGYSNISIETTHAFSSRTGQSVDDRLLTTIYQYPGPSPLVLYQLNQRATVELARFKWDSTSWIKQANAPGDTSQSLVMFYQNKPYIDGYFFESCSLHPTPSRPPVLIVNLATNTLPGGISGRSYFVSGELVNWDHMFAFPIDASELRDTPMIVEPEGPWNINFMDCADVNGDGFEDLVTYPYRSGARPNVYLNNGSGTLVRLPDAMMPDGPTGSNWTAQMVDSNGDGIRDLVYFPGNGCSNGGGQVCATFQLWRGRRQLVPPAAAAAIRLKARRP